MENKQKWWRFPDLKELQKIWDDNILLVPYETVFKIALLSAGAIRSFDLLKTMGQSAIASVSGLLFAEAGIIVYEILVYRGKRISKKYKAKKIYVDFKSPYIHILTMDTYKYPFLNQKRLAGFGLWFIHIPIAVFFSSADVIMQNIQALSGNGASIQETFTWILGAVIAIAIFGDLATLILFGMVNPKSVHEEAVSQIIYEKQMWELEKQRIMQEAEMQYEKEHAMGLATAEIRFKKGAEMVEKHSGTFDKDYILSHMGDDEFKDMYFKDKSKPEPKKTTVALPIGKTRGRPPETKRKITPSLIEHLDPILPEEKIVDKKDMEEFQKLFTEELNKPNFE